MARKGTAFSETPATYSRFTEMDHAHEFAELDRRYEELPFDDKNMEELAKQKSMARFLGYDEGKPLSDYFNEPLCVVLGEARSGKTTEFEETARKVKQSGRYAFFVRMENLATGLPSPLQSLQYALPSSEDIEIFEKWLTSDDEAFFFLDAKDEAQLTGIRNYENAIKHFERALSVNLSRVRLFVSCRTTEWRGHTDAALLKPLVPKLAPLKKPPDTVNERSAYPFKFLQILPLDLPRIDKFCRVKQVQNADAFINALRDADATDFSGRPGDVEGLIALWGQKGRLGTLTEIIEADIKCKIDEVNDAYRRQHPLSSEQSLKGLETLAAASVLCQQPHFSFTTPANDVDSSLPALNPFELLPDWPPAHVQALMRCAVFDEATYSRVRIHTRTVREYLTAKWFDSRLKEDCPPQDICEVLFSDLYGAETIIPSRASVSAWLAPGMESIFNKLLRSNPEILCHDADPQCLTLHQKQRVLNAFRDRYRDHERTGLRFDPYGLRRFAEAGLCEAVNSYLSDSATPQHFREFLLDLVKSGKMTGCTSECLSIALDTEVSPDLRVDAIQAIEACEAPEALRVVHEYLLNADQVPDRFFAYALWFLYPAGIETGELLDLIREAPEKVRHPGDHVCDFLNNILEKEISRDRLFELMIGITKLLQSDSGERHEWLYSVLYVCLKQWVEIQADLPGNILESLFLAEAHEERDNIDTRIKRDRLKETIEKASPSFRKKFFSCKYDKNHCTRQNKITY